jgi:hypothetical protein
MEQNTVAALLRSHPPPISNALWTAQAKRRYQGGHEKKEAYQGNLWDRLPSPRE